MGHDSGFAATPPAPGYRVGRDRAGRWLAMERSGRGGGMFATREAAMRFALGATAGQAGAVALAVEPLGFV